MILELLFGGIISLILLLRFLKRKPVSPKQICAILGSGGHTNEMLRLIEGLSDELKPTVFICSLSDTLSQSKISQVSTKGQQQRQIFLLPRPRNVGQSYFTSIFTTLRTIWFSTIMLYNCNPSLILCNGPGICVCVALSCFLLSTIFGMTRPKLVYVESFARTSKLSLTGYIMQLLTDKFFVQWEALERPKGLCTCARSYIGLLV